MDQKDCYQAEYERLKERSRKSLVPGLLLSAFAGICMYPRGFLAMLLAFIAMLSVFGGEYWILKYIKVTDYKSALKKYYFIEIVVTIVNILCFVTLGLMQGREKRFWMFIVILCMTLVQKIVNYRASFLAK